MSRVRFIKEVELRSSPKFLFHYFSTAEGLQEWFADEVKALEHKLFEFNWNGETSMAKKVSQKAGKFVQYEFLPESPAQKTEPPVLEFSLQYNDLTGTTFVQVVDYTDEDMSDLEEMWSNMFSSLMEIIGRS